MQDKLLPNAATESPHVQTGSPGLLATAQSDSGLSRSFMRDILDTSNSVVRSSALDGHLDSAQVKVPFRLKVVGLPDGYGEEQLRSLFALAGAVVEARVVHDKASGRAVGYGYVSFASKEAADLAISTLDDQLQLPGAEQRLSVYYAKKQHDQMHDGESCPARNAKMYFCGTPSGFKRDSVLALFSAFGRVRHLQVYTDSLGVLSSGTVTMYTTEEATAAMTNLDGKVLQPGTAPLKVTWAQLSTLPRRHPAVRGPPPPMPKGFTVSYAYVPIIVTPSEIAALFGRFGSVLQVVPFAHRRDGPAGSRGCGLVVMESEQGACEAINALSGKFTWAGAERPMQVQVSRGAERPGSQQLSTLPDGLVASNGNGLLPSRGRYFLPGQRVVSSSAVESPAEEPAPPGCAPDAFKLVLTNLPNSCSQADVLALLQPYGTVVSLFRQQGPEATGDGTVTVWYANGAQARAALDALSNTMLLAADGTRQLTVIADPTSQCNGMVQYGRGLMSGRDMTASSGGGGWDPRGSLAVANTLSQMGHQQHQSQPVMVYMPTTAAQSQQGLPVAALAAGDVAVPAGWPQQASGAAGAVQVVAAPNGPVRDVGHSSLDMQQLMYVLPQSSVAPTVMSTVLAPGTVGQGWSLAAPPASLAQINQQNQLSAAGLNISGNVFEPMQAGSSASTVTIIPNSVLPNATMPVVTAAPGAAFTGWW